MQALIATLRLGGRPGRVGCQSALWDCLDELAAMLKMRAPKQSHNAPHNHLDPVSAQPQPQTSKPQPQMANSVGSRENNGRERETPSFALGTDVNFTKVIFKPVIRLN